MVLKRLGQRSLVNAANLHPLRTDRTVGVKALTSEAEERRGGRRGGEKKERRRREGFLFLLGCSYSKQYNTEHDSSVAKYTHMYIIA